MELKLASSKTRIINTHIQKHLCQFFRKLTLSLSNSNTVCFPLLLSAEQQMKQEYLYIGAIFFIKIFIWFTLRMTKGSQQEKYMKTKRGQFRSPVLPSSRGTHLLSRLPASHPHHPWPLPGSLCLSHRDVHSLSSHFPACPLHESVSLWQLFIHWLTHIFSLCFSVPHAPLSGKNISFQDWLWKSKTCHLHCCPGYRNVLGFVFI